MKSLVVARSDGTFLFALVPGDRQIAWAKLRAAVGVNKLRLPSADEALAATGYERGTIVPLGSTTAWPVFADERIAGRVALGAGEHGFSAFVDAAALLDGARRDGGGHHELTRRASAAHRHEGGRRAAEFALIRSE